MPMGAHAADNGCRRALAGGTPSAVPLRRHRPLHQPRRRDGLVQLLPRRRQPRGGFFTGRSAAWLKERICRYTDLEPAPRGARPAALPLARTAARPALPPRRRPKRLALHDGRHGPATVRARAPAPAWRSPTACSASVAEAEDVVQEAWLRWQRRDARRASSRRAPGSRTVGDTAVPRPAQVGARAPREVRRAVAARADAHRERGRARSRSRSRSAFLVLLERLSPLERAVYLLHEVFDYCARARSAAMVGDDEAACRQLFHRAQAARRRAAAALRAVARGARSACSARFVQACTRRRSRRRCARCSPPTRRLSDGGGKAHRGAQAGARRRRGGALLRRPRQEAGARRVAVELAERQRLARRRSCAAPTGARQVISLETDGEHIFTAQCRHRAATPTSSSGLVEA